jgi:hypothetical protein
MKKLSLFALILASVCAYWTGSHCPESRHRQRLHRHQPVHQGVRRWGQSHSPIIGTLATTPGAVAIISDGSPGTTCSGGGTGVIAVYLNGAWNCAASGLTAGQGLSQVGGTIGLISCPSGQAPQSTGSRLCLRPIWLGAVGGGGNTTAGSAQGQVPAWDVGSSLFAPQTKSVVDVRDNGVDCSGVSDSGAALNTLFTNINGKEIDFPSTCTIKTTIQIVIQGQSGFRLRGLGSRSAVAGFVGPVIYGCNAAASGPVLYINRSGYGVIEGLSITSKGPSACSTSTFTGSIQIDSTGNPGVTTHNIILDNLGLTTSPLGGTVTNYKAISITDGGKQNGEMIRVKNSWVSCQLSSGSIGIDLENATSDKDEFSDNHIVNCFIGVKHGGGNATIRENLFSSLGNFSTYGSNGGAIWIGTCASGPINIINNEMDSSGQFINSSNDGVGGGCNAGLNVTGNILGVTDAPSGSYVINIGNSSGGVFYNLIGNQFLVVANTNQYLVGSASQGVNGPLGWLFDMNNSMRAPTSSNSLGFTNLNFPFQSGEYHTPLSFFGNAANATVGPNSTGASFDSISRVMLANPPHNTTAQQSPFLEFRSYGGSTYSGFAFQSESVGSAAQLTLDYTRGTASTIWTVLRGQTSGMTFASVANPATPGIVVIGTPGSTTYSYSLVAYSPNGNTAASGTVTTNTGNLSPSTVNFNQLQWFPTAGAVRYCIRRESGGSSQGIIGCVSSVGASTAVTQANSNTYQFNDTGLVGDGTAAPTTNTTGKLITSAPTTDAAGFNLPHGTAPSSPVNGDTWTTTSGLFARINGATVGPFGTTAAPAGTDGQLVLMNNSGGFKVVTGLLYDSTNGLQLPLPYQVTSAFPGSAMGTAPDVSHSSIGVDTDGKFKVSESGGAVTELAKVNSSITGNAATATNVSGSPTASQYYGTNGASTKGFYNLPGSSSCHYNAIPGSSDQISTATAFATTVSVANTCIGVGSLITIRAHGVYTTTATASPTFQLQVSAGGTTGICPAAGNTAPNTNQTNAYWDATCHIQINTTGGPGTAVAWGQYLYTTVSGGTANVRSFNNSSTGTVSFTTTSSQTVSVGITSTPVAGQTWNMTAIDVIVTN